MKTNSFRIVGSASWKYMFPNENEAGFHEKKPYPLRCPWENKHFHNAIFQVRKQYENKWFRLKIDPGDHFGDHFLDLNVYIFGGPFSERALEPTGWIEMINPIIPYLVMGCLQ